MANKKEDLNLEGCIFLFKCIKRETLRIKYRHLGTEKASK